MTEGELADFLATRAQETWDLKREPYLLSLVATELKDRAVNYKEILGDEKLKAFAKRIELDGKLKLVEHPRQRAKVGVIPPDQEFSFLPTGGAASALPRRASGRGDEEVILSFFRALGALPDELLDQVVIPAKAITHLLRKK